MRVEQHQGERLARRARLLAGPPGPRGRPPPPSAACPSWPASPRGCGGWWRCRPPPARAGRRTGRGSGRAAPAAGPGPGRTGAVKWNVLPLAELALDPDRPAHQLDQLRPRSPGPARCRRTCGSSRRPPARTASKSQPAACRAGCRCRCRGRRSAGATLLARSATRTSTRTHDLAPLGELDGVADQVDEDLPQPAGVADQRVRARRRRRGRPAPGPSRGPAGPAWPGCRRGARGGRSRWAPGRACRPRSWRSRGCR